MATQELKFPKYLSIQTTSLCNASCIFCPYKDIKNLFPKKIMDISLFKKIIDECSQYKTIERIILYMNNEPLTDPYLIERINYAKEKVPWASVHILTNGLLLTEEIADKILNSKLDWIGISFQGIRKETIEKAMGINFNLAFKRVNSFIEKAKKEKDIKEYLMITFLRHKYLGREEKEEAFKYWQSKGIKRISYFDGPISRAGNVKSLPWVYHKEKIVGCKSIWADEMLHIVEDGRVVLCCMDWRREVILGDLNKESIYSVWNGRRKRTWEMIYGKRKMPDNFLCRRCEEAVTFDNHTAALDSPDIVFINLPPWGIDTSPLGTACLSSYLKSRGLKVEVFDLNIKLYNKVFEESKHLWSMNYSYLWRQKEDFLKIYKKLQPHIDLLIEEITQFSSKVLGFSLPTNCSDLILEEIVKKVKDTDSSKIIILGGVSISIKEQRQDLLKEVKDYIDYCIVGEGEEALYKLMLSIMNAKYKKGKVKGVLNKETLLGDISPIYVADLDKLSFPTFEEFNLSEYKVSNSVSMEFSRGCIGNCPFCDFKSVSPLFRQKSASYIFNQIKFYKEKYSIDHISVCDAAVNGGVKVLEEVCDLLIKNNLTINISALAIPRKEMTQDLLRKMKKAGFYRLEYGVESGSNKILKAMRKIFTKEIAERVIRDTYTAGIKTYLYFIVGYPGETEEDFNETKEFLKRNAGYITTIKSINPLYIMAGSEIFYNYQKYNIVLPPKNSDREWYIGNQNTYSLRRKRVLDLKAVADSLGVPFTEEAESLEFTRGFPSKKATLIQEEKERASLPKKKEKILLTIAPMWDVSLPPLGLAYLAGYLENKMISVDVLDINAELYAKSSLDRKKLWRMENYNLWAQDDLFNNVKKIFKKDIDFYTKKILDGGYNIVGFSLYGANILFSIEIVKRLKRENRDIFIIFGGSSCYFVSDNHYMPVNSMISPATGRSFIDPGDVDSFVIGEGEESLYRLIVAYIKGEYSNLSGVIIYDKKKRKYISFLPCCLIGELDSIPFPQWSQFELNLYSSNNTLPIIFGRGCVNRCSFCNDWRIWGGKYRNRPSFNIFKEIVHNHSELNISNFQCNDLLFNANLTVLEKLAGYIIKSGINISWSAQGVIRKDMDLKLLERLRRSGFNHVTYGVESLSENVLSKMGKHYDFDTVVKVLKDTKKAGIGTSINLIVGFPGEEDNDFNITKKRLAMISKYIDEISSLNPCYITGYSELEENPAKFFISLPKTDWWYKWETVDGKNTYELRKNKTKELSELIKKHNVRINFIGIYDEVKVPNVKDAGIDKNQYNFLFINLPPWGQENPHIGIGYLCEYLRQKNINPVVLDLNKRFFLNHPDFKMLWHVENKNFWSNKHTFPLLLEVFKQDIDKAIEEIISLNCDILGFSVVDPKERLTIEFIKRIKEKTPDKKVILGGPATSTSEQRRIFLDNIPDYIDVFVVGEGEEVLADIINDLRNSGNIALKRGALLPPFNSCNNNGVSAVVRDIKSIPLPAYKEFNMSLYGKSILVEWSRGCIGNCAFCKNWHLFGGYRPKRVDNIIAELCYHIENYNIREFTVVDNLLDGDIRLLNEVCDNIIKKRLNISWNGQIAPRKEMTLRMYKKMKEAGCNKLQIGVESGSNKVLKKMRKFYTSDIAEYNIRNAKEAGIETEVFIIIGFPSEGEKEFMQTYNFIKRNREWIDTIKSINTLHLIAGTDVFNNYRDYNIKPLPEENWHYLWKTYDGNSYAIRKKRAERLLDLAFALGIKVMETNIKEGKESELFQNMESMPLSNKIEAMRTAINNLQPLPQGEKRFKHMKKHSLFRFSILGAVFLYAFFYITYFWIFKKLRGKAILGGV